MVYFIFAHNKCPVNFFYSKSSKFIILDDVLDNEVISIVVLMKRDNFIWASQYRDEDNFFCNKE